MIDYLAIGHIAQDVTPGGVRLGGTVAYAALTAHALGLRAGVITAAAPDAVMEGLEHIAVYRLPSERSTVFENRYTPAGRTQTLHARAEPITLRSVPAEWRTANIVHLAPIANEVDYALVRHFPGAFIGITPQGWMRQWDANGLVTRGEWAGADSLLRSASAVVLSLEDVSGDWERVERWADLARVFAVTQGAEGATVYAGGDRRHFPAPDVEVADATGAGDVFAAAFFARLWRTGNLWQAAESAVALASRSVTRVGLDGVPQSGEGL